MIQTHALTKRFDDFLALDSISCTIPQGCIYGMVGSNGAGKSTFLRILAGIYRADGGSATFDGEPIYENPCKKAQIAFVPDGLFFLGGANMNRMAKLYAAIHHDFDTARFAQLTKLFGLDPQKNLNTFSKGMKRQAATILALSSHPQYLFFDETFDGLDPIMRHTVKNLICEEVLERNATAIITSHSLRELEDTCDQLALLHKGGLVLESDIQNLKTSLFKVQIAFSHEFSEGDFSMLDILNFVKRGSVANLIVRGNREETVAKLSALSPILLDVLPLSLEEVFTYEMEALGYTAGGILEV
ncbi:MAG: ABC transporter ATP-binding protein [Clostridia bacterium]|jgi:ABC-2 type transport system ATP-binding protein|nr:ABC transporter ATP-binding protein [Clostridia bacterium]